METCYWVYSPGHFAKTECGEYLYLSKTLGLSEESCFDSYLNCKCPSCGGKIKIDADSYRPLEERPIFLNGNKEHGGHVDCVPRVCRD